VIQIAAGDIETYIVAGDDDGTKADTALTGNGIVVADSVSCCSLPGGRVFVLVVKAA